MSIYQLQKAHCFDMHAYYVDTLQHLMFLGRTWCMQILTKGLAVVISLSTWTKKKWPKQQTNKKSDPNPQSDFGKLQEKKDHLECILDSFGAKINGPMENIVAGQ